MRSFGEDAQTDAQIADTDAMAHRALRKKRTVRSQVIRAKLGPVNLSLGHLPHPRATPSYLTARNTNRQPHCSGGIACDYVTEEMHAEVNSTEADSEHQTHAQRNDGAWE